MTGVLRRMRPSSTTANRRSLGHRIPLIWLGSEFSSHDRARRSVASDLPQPRRHTTCLARTNSWTSVQQSKRFRTFDRGRRLRLLQKPHCIYGAVGADQFIGPARLDRTIASESRSALRLDPVCSSRSQRPPSTCRASLGAWLGVSSIKNGSRRLVTWKLPIVA